MRAVTSPAPPTPAEVTVSPRRLTYETRLLLRAEVDRVRRRALEAHRRKMTSASHAGKG
jgi:hypothetical protein